jgi:hypothetical protein
MIFANSTYTGDADTEGFCDILHQTVAVVKSDAGGKKKERLILASPERQKAGSGKPVAAAAAAW